MRITSTLIVTAVALASNTLLAGPAPLPTPETSSSFGLLIAGIAALLVVRRIFKAA